MIDDDLAHRCWEDAADAWDAFVESGLDFYRIELHGPALLGACGEVAGRDILDLGCGQGWFSRQLAGAGARVTGLDWSAALIAHARRHETARPLGVRYCQLDARRLAEYAAPDTFDLITGCMSIMDMPEPGAVLAAARTALRRDGRLVFSVPHPVTDSPHRLWRRDANGTKLALELDGYFAAPTQLMDWSMARLEHRFHTVQYRHTLEQWSLLFEAAGLRIARLREPQPSAAAVANRPALAAAGRVPFFLIFDLTR